MLKKNYKNKMGLYLKVIDRPILNLLVLISGSMHFVFVEYP